MRDDETALAIAGFGVMLALIAARLHVGLAMLVTGAAGYAWLSSWPAFLAYMKTNSYHQFANYTLSVIPLFILMGALAEHSGLSTKLFRAAACLVGRLRGGLAYAVIVSCAGFGAICGSSVATTATFGRAALPELERYKYDGGFATGVIAVGGRLHSHPALGHSRRVRDRDRAEYRETVHGGSDPRAAGRGVLLRHDFPCRAAPTRSCARANGAGTG